MEKNIKFGQQSTKVKQLSDLIEQDILVGSIALIRVCFHQCIE